MMTAGPSFDEIIKRGLLAGFAGGLAEIVWVSLYAAITGGNAAILARGVTTAAGVTAVLPATPVAVGVAVHMLLAMALGVALICAWQMVARRHTISLSGFVLVALTVVWAVNFFVVLPLVSPQFVGLVPYSVSLVSKLLFGLAAAETLRHFSVSRKTLVPARL